MKAYPSAFGVLHFIGIGGIGMSGIAEVMHNLGYRVQGSDVVENANVRRLQGLGVDVSIGHKGGNLGAAAAVVISSAVPADNVEIQEAENRGLPLVPRSEMLAELMRMKTCVAVGGTHGKTTTTSMISALLDVAAMDPTVINGGIINAYGTNARLGSGDWMVVEADESDGSFLRLPSAIAVVTNIDREHLDYYKSFEELRGAFRQFVENVPFYGIGVLCSDNEEVRALANKVGARRLLTYGLEEGASIRGRNLKLNNSGSSFDVEIRGGPRMEEKVLKDVRLNMPGAHNVRNALAMISISCELGLSEEIMREALEGFRGVKRRFTLVEEIDGVRIIDDYAHHPVEIGAVLQTAKQICDGRVIAIVQPHRFSRLKSLFKQFCNCFNDADMVFVADVYPAGEQPLEGVNRDALVEGILASGHSNVSPILSPDSLPDLVRKICNAGDMVVFLGAGTVTTWANELPRMMNRPERSGGCG
ncbi:MAG: UDP-N-acetylmuramate--L-alanine ligase [Rhodospirillaceae bacterium]|nr:UDP-N-acetylmuramate--L-alanine ligase [Rhodospirillaceae bacterium]